MAPPQSGRSSAVGFMIESAWCNVPITLISGNNYRPGIDATNPNRFFIVEPGGGYQTTPIKDVGVDEQDGDFDIHRITLTGKQYNGKDTFKLDPENLYYPLLGLFGRDVQTTLGGGAYGHEFRHYKYQPSLSQEEQFGDGSSGRLSSGVVIDSINITHGNILMAEVGYRAHRQIPNRYDAAALVETDYDFTSAGGLLPSQLGGNHTKRIQLTAVPSYVDVAQGNCGNGPLVYANAKFGDAAGFSGCYVTLNDSPYAINVPAGWNVNLSRNIESHQVAGSGFDMDAPVANEFMATGRMPILFQDNTFPAATLSNCKIGICMMFRGAQIASSGFYYQYQIYMPNVRFTEADNPRASSKTAMTGGAFTARKDPSLGYSVQVKLQNSFTNASLAGQVGSYQGIGLGGWINS